MNSNNTYMDMDMEYIYIVCNVSETDVSYVTNTLENGIKLANELCDSEGLEKMIDVYLLRLPLNTRLHPDGIFSTRGIKSTMVDF